MWVKLPTWELLALELEGSAQLYDLLMETSKLPQSVNPTSDVCVVIGRKVLDPGLPLQDQGVEEGRARIHDRLGGGAPGSGQPERYAFIEGRCEYGSRCQHKHEQRASNCVICGSDDHGWEECVRYGGCRYDSKDPKVLAAAERRAAKARQPKGPPWPSSEHSRPVELPHAQFQSSQSSAEKDYISSSGNSKW